MKTLGRLAGAAVGLSLITVWAGCGGASTTTAGAASPTSSASPAAGVAATEPAPAAETAPAAAASGTPAPAASGSAAAVPAEQPSSELSEAQRHGPRRHAGVLGLVVLSLDDLDLSADQRVTINGIRDRLKETMRPVHQAGEMLEDTLADGVAAGKVDEGKVNPAIDNLVSQVSAVHSASMAALDELHQALTPSQRAELMGAVKAHWAMWKESQGREPTEGREGRPGRLSALADDLGLTADQVKQVQANFRAQTRQARQERGYEEMNDHLRAFAAAFEADRFDANKVAKLKGSSHMVRWGATRTVRFVEAALPVLTADQRAKLAETLRDRAARDR